MRVFILGAGFSRCCDYPSGKELFGAIYDNIEFTNWKYFEEFKKNCLDALSDLGVDILKKDEVYFDELISRINEFSQVGKDHKGIYIPLKIVLTETAKSYFYKKLKENSQILKPVINFVKGLKKNVKPIDSDIIISFNWDLLVEYAIANTGYTYSYDFFNGDIPVLKPHGSINWQRVLTYEGIEIHNGFNEYDSEHKIKGDQVMIVPYDKERLQIRRLKKVQEQTEDVLSQTNEIILIGYSLPEYDIYVKNMFEKIILPRNGNDLIPSQIKIVDTDQSTIEKYKNMFGNDIIINKCKFEESIYASE